jgi:hypothetical protein
MSSNNPNYYHSGDTAPVIMRADNEGYNFFIGDLVVFENSTHSKVTDAASGGSVVVEIISTQFWGGPQPKAT